MNKIMNIRNCFILVVFLLCALHTAAQEVVTDTINVESVSSVSESKKTYVMALKTNALYTLLAVPNVGAEIHLGKRWTVSANWMYAWWHIDSKHYYWRTYGGDVAIRKYFGKSSKNRSFGGHHLGLYGQMLTYDVEWGDRGYQSDKWTYGGGLEYGYSFGIGKRLNLDLTLGVGYLMGQYMEYDPIDDCYVWQFTKKQNWIGPTKAEVSLVWLLWKKKGGKK